MNQDANKQRKGRMTESFKGAGWLLQAPSTPEEKKKLLGIFARLANIESLGALKASEKFGLVEDVRQTHPRYLMLEHSGLEPCLHNRRLWWRVPEGERHGPGWGSAASTTLFLFSCDPQLTQSWGLGEKVPFEWEVLLQAHPFAHSCINTLVDGERISLAPFGQLERGFLSVNTETWQPQEIFEADSMRDVLVRDLGQLLRQSPFPFRRCPVTDCKNVFVPGKNQKYCSPPCTTRGAEAARRDEHRKYMREYMADRRKKAKEKPVVTIRGTLTGKAENR